MSRTDLILLHAPSVYDFRKKSILYGPVSDMIPSTQVFEMYPIGFMSIREYLERHGYSVRIMNIAMKMLGSRKFDVEKCIASLHPVAFGIDLHWLVHAQGSLELAKIVKKYHPETAVIFGGLSSSYYHEELISYSQVDYVIRGDSAEEPLRRLLSTIVDNSSKEDVPNLTWKENGGVRVNEFSHVPQSFDDIVFDYGTMLRSTAKYFDLTGHVPFRKWLNYPIVTAMTCRGCAHDCVVCGGSASAFERFCSRKKPVFRSPIAVANDIKAISKYFNTPIIILGDIMQSGFSFAKELLLQLKGKSIRNQIAFELFSPPPKYFLELLAEAVRRFNIQISPETHDETIRKGMGKNYDNSSLEKAIENALELGCKRIDVFFMIGLPYQTKQSVRETIRYCRYLMEEYGNGAHKRVHPYISPLAPFLDPGSRAFENPEEHGYRIIHRTLEEHRAALISPSWKYTLNYETRWLSRDELVDVTYEAARELNGLKREYGILTLKEARVIEQRIRLERQMIDEIDTVISMAESSSQEEVLTQKMRHYNFIDHSTMCRKDEMNWPTRFKRFKIFGALKELKRV